MSVFKKLWEFKHVIIIATMVLIAIFFVVEIIKFVKEHSCIEYKTYCYYEDLNMSVGVVHTANESGGVGVAIVPYSTKIYIDCKKKDIVPHKVHKERRCVKRKGL